MRLNPRHMTAREKFLAMFADHRSWMEKTRRRVERGEQIPQDIDGQARKDLFAYGIIASVTEKGASVLIVASDEIAELFKNPEIVEEAKSQAPPSGRQMQIIEDEVTTVMDARQLNGLRRRSTPPPPPRSKRGTVVRKEAPPVVEGDGQDVSQIT